MWEINACCKFVKVIFLSLDMRQDNVVNPPALPPLMQVLKSILVITKPTERGEERERERGKRDKRGAGGEKQNKTNLSASTLP
jgi:hypothetical protein